MAVLKAMTSGGKRRESDFYPTPPEATRALLPLIAHWPRRVWEPCCGDGAISRVLEAEGYSVNSTDLVYRGYGIGDRDFFKCEAIATRIIITNPPFNLADEFITHAQRLEVGYMALLLKIDFWNAAKRRRTFYDWPPASVHPLTWRLDFTGAGRPHTNCMWCLWEPRGGNSLTKFLPISRPAVSETEILEDLMA